MAKKIKEKKVNNTYEVCVLCKHLTNVKITENIKKRKYYVVGCGQLCKECYLKLYGK